MIMMGITGATIWVIGVINLLTTPPLTFQVYDPLKRSEVNLRINDVASTTVDTKNPA